jgi:hypothetical protein
MFLELLDGRCRILPDPTLVSSLSLSTSDRLLDLLQKLIYKSQIICVYLCSSVVQIKKNWIFARSLLLLRLKTYRSLFFTEVVIFAVDFWFHARVVPIC